MWRNLRKGGICLNGLVVRNKLVKQRILGQMRRLFFIWTFVIHQVQSVTELGFFTVCSWHFRYQFSAFRNKSGYCMTGHPTINYCWECS